MPPVFTGRGDPARIVLDIVRRVERVERQQNGGGSSGPSTPVGSGGTASRARAIKVDTGGPLFPIFTFSSYTDESTFEWSNATNLKHATGALAFGDDDQSIITTGHMLVGATLTGFTTLDSTPLNPPILFLEIYTALGEGHQYIETALPVINDSLEYGPGCVHWFGEMHVGDLIIANLNSGVTSSDAFEIDVCGFLV